MLIIADWTHHLVVPSAVSPEVIITNPVRDIIMTLVLLNLCIMYGTCVVMVPNEVSVVVKQQDLVICQLLAMRTDKDAAFRVTARVSPYYVNEGV